MTLEEFLVQTHEDVRTEIGSRLGSLQDEYPYAELIFAEIVMEHLADNGMTFEPQICHYNSKVGNAQLRLTGHYLHELLRTHTEGFVADV